MIGRNGKTIYIVDHIDDTVKERGSEGNDEVRAKISYTLGNKKPGGIDNVENLKLLGKANINATGNDLDNVITGNKGNNILKGGAGKDKVTGGKGNDMLKGGAKADQFIFKKGDGKDVIQDYKDGQDKIVIGKGANKFGQLDIVEYDLKPKDKKVDPDVLIKFANVEIIVEDADVSDFTKADFIL